MRLWMLVLMVVALAACETAPGAESLQPALAALAEAAPPPVPAGPPPVRADASLDRSGQSRIRATVKAPLLWIPSGFASDDGAYDLLVAFHTHRPVLRESIENSGIDAVVVNVNLGAGAGNYERVFSDPQAFAKLLANVGPALEARGLQQPRLRRVGLVSWSAGYGAVVRILSQPDNAARVDAVAILDGMHAHLVGDSDQIDDVDLDPYTAYARRAAAGDAFLLVTHNHIVPEGKIASVSRTTQAVLDRLELRRESATGTVEAPTLKANDGVYSKRRSFDLELESVAHRGGLWIKQFTGRQRNDHVCHLMAMTPLALEPLAARWRELRGGAAPVEL